MQGRTDIASAIEQYRSGWYADAERVLKRLVETEPPDATVLHLLGLIARQRGRRAEAIDLMERAIELRPSEAGS